MGIGNWSSFHTPFNEREILSFVPIKPGVYALWANNQSGEWRCFYVGRADDLEGRLLAHLGDGESNPCVKENLKKKCGFRWLVITSEAERAGAEKFLYDKMKTECNQADPGGKPLQIPLPPATLTATPAAPRA